MKLALKQSINFTSSSWTTTYSFAMVFKFLLHCVFLLLFKHCVNASKSPEIGDFDPTYQTTSRPDADWSRALVTPPWRPVVSGAAVSVDLIFLIDGSGSVEATGILNFNKLKRWLKSVASAFDFSNEKFRVGVVQYSHSFRHLSLNAQRLLKTELELGGCANIACFNTYVEKMQYMGYTTYTGAAINKTIKEDFAASNADVVKILILVTDGPSDDDVITAADFARKKNVTLFSVGIGNYNLSQLQWIANGEIGNNWRVYRVRTFGELSTVVASLQREIKATYDIPACSPLLTPIHGDLSCTNANEVGSTCTTSCRGKYTAQGSQNRSCLMDDLTIGPHWNGSSTTCGVCAAKFDLLFILDSSSSIGQASFNVMKDFVMRLGDTFEIGRSEVQVSAIRYNSRVENLWNYDKYRDKNSLMQSSFNPFLLRVNRPADYGIVCHFDANDNAITEISYSGVGTDTAAALYYALDHKFGPDSGRREDKPHMTVVLTDGKSKRSIKTPAQRLHQISQVLAIGVNNADQAEIDEIASDPDELYSHKVIDNFVDLLKIIRESSMKLCEAQAAVSNIVCPYSSLTDPTGCLSFICSNGNKAGSVCKASCCQGFNLPANDLSSCYYNGKWSVSKWRCIENRCEAIKPVNGLRLSCSSGNSLGSICTISCDPGFYLSGALDNTTCNSSSSGDFYRCSHTCIKTAQHSTEWNKPPVTCRQTQNCHATACHNGGKCKNGISSFTCKCPEGFAGDRCETDIDECASDPCENDGTCENLENSFKCRCVVGFSGTRCDVDIDECSPHPCHNNGTCVDLINGYECNCPTGFSGRNCEVAVDWCATRNCSNRGRCQNSSVGYECHCNVGYVGRDCEVDYDECEGQPCLNGGICYQSQTVGEYVCYCKNGFAGHSCEFDVPECLSSPCKNGGVCNESIGFYSCICGAGYEGVNCEKEIDRCASQPCENNATCLKRVEGDGYNCTCEVGFTGKRCEMDVDECASSPCINGVCSNLEGSFKCLCNDSYEGALCDIPPDHCRNITCQNGAPCINLPDGFFCNCSQGFNGTLCDQDINECLPNPCYNEGACINGNASFSCLCTYGYEGLRCEHKTINCSTEPCVNAESCTDDEKGSYVCNCMEGFEGRRCERNKNECLAEPCENGGECEDLDAGYKCNCLAGYTGVWCQDKVDHCKSAPCLNGGQCEGGTANYTCHCLAGHHGIVCGETCNDCSCGPCANSGVCLHAAAGFVCRCTDRYRGRNCLQDVNECSRNFCGGAGQCLISGDGVISCLCDPGYDYTGASCEPSTDLLCNPSPCHNGGVCSTQTNGYTCNCSGNYFGRNCQYSLDNANCTGFDPCLNGGACLQNANGIHLCSCPSGFFGEFCERNESACVLNLCPLNSFCVETNQGYWCVCNSGFTGEDCSQTVNECESNPCANGANCTDKDNMYWCDCHPGWTGERCQHDLNECEVIQSVCNGRECLNTIGSYMCCDGISSGGRCHVNDDECASNPCQHGGACVDKQIGYYCNCSTGYIGINCETDIDDCALDPCKNNGTCIDQTPGFQCNCTEGYGGASCEVVVDHCRVGEQPKCSNGLCINGDRGFTCKCPPGLGGTACDQVLCVLPLDATGRSGRILCRGDGSAGTVCELICDRDSVPLDLTYNNTRTCEDSGEWSGTDESLWSCVAPSCPKIPGTDISSSSTTPQNTRSFSLVGVVLKSALVDPQASCDNGSAVGSTCVFSCPDDYRLIGSADSSTCSNDGQWVPTPSAKCAPAYCTKPDIRVDPKFSNLDVSGLTCSYPLYEQDSMCFPICHNGFIISKTSPDMKKCKNGQWTPPEPFSCVPSACRGPPPNTHNGRYECTNSVFLKSYCESKCNPGYIEAIRGSYTCTMRNGYIFWDGRQGICREKLCQHSVDLRSGTVQELQESSAVRIQLAPSRNEDLSCRRRAKIVINPTLVGAIFIDVWYGSNPTGYHLHIGYDFSESNQGESGIFGNNTSLIFRGNNWIGAESSNFFRSGDHLQIMITANYIYLNNHRQNRTIDISHHEPFPVAIGINQALSPDDRPGSGLCVLCINTT